jgi:nucleotide-binding universal stress UspA family protein
MTKTIIVPLDGSTFAERALVPAQSLARQSGAELVLVMSRLGGETEPERYLESTAVAAGLDSARSVVFTDRLAASAIPLLADTEPDALVCMTTHGRSGAGHALFGSIAEAVVRELDVPLVLVGPSVRGVGTARFEELIVCLDGSRMATAIVPAAQGFARDLGLGMCLVDVVDPERGVPADAENDVGASESGSLQRVAHGLEGGDLTVNWETLHGRDAASAIVEFADSRRSPLVAMTTHGRTGLARIAVGSVTMAVVRRSACPVLVMRSRDLVG